MYFEFGFLLFFLMATPQNFFLLVFTPNCFKDKGFFA